MDTKAIEICRGLLKNIKKNQILTLLRQDEFKRSLRPWDRFLDWDWKLGPISSNGKSNDFITAW